MIWDPWETNWTGVKLLIQLEQVIENGPDVGHRQGLVVEVEQEQKEASN